MAAQTTEHLERSAPLRHLTKTDPDPRARRRAQAMSRAAPHPWAR